MSKVNVIRHRAGDGSYKTPPAGVHLMSSDDLGAVVLSMPDQAVDDLLAGVGEEQLGLCPVAAFGQRVCYVISGRNSLAVKFAVWDACVRGGSYWRRIDLWCLVVIPATVGQVVLPPEFVEAVDPREIGVFSVVSGL
jgi:hypothetical protein